MSIRGFWIGTSNLAGMLLTTYVGRLRTREPGRQRDRRLLLPGYRMPIYNKLIVALLGVSGAMDYAAQPFLGALGMLVLSAALGYRIHSLRRTDCRVDLAA